MVYILIINTQIQKFQYSQFASNGKREKRFGIQKYEYNEQNDNKNDYNKV